MKYGSWEDKSVEVVAQKATRAHDFAISPDRGVSTRSVVSGLLLLLLTPTEIKDLKVDIAAGRIERSGKQIQVRS